MTPKSNDTKEMIDLVRQVTQAITVISESTKQNVEITGAIKEMISVQNTADVKAFETLNGKSDGLEAKMEGLMTMFKYVIVPLIGGILALVGVKLVFNQ